MTNTINDIATRDGLGPQAAKDFAISDPYYATRNADSYGFYIADTYNTRRVVVPTVIRY